MPGRAVHRGKFLEVPWLAFPASSSCRGLVSSRQAPLAGALSLHLKYFVLEWLQGNPRRTLAVVRQALPRGAATARAQVRDTRVPLLQYTDNEYKGTQQDLHQILSYMHLYQEGMWGLVAASQL